MKLNQQRIVFILLTALFTYIFIPTKVYAGSLSPPIQAEEMLRTENKIESDDRSEASDSENSAEIEEELKRLSDETDFSDWQMYFDELKSLTGTSPEYDSVKEMIEAFALSDSDIQIESILDLIWKIFVPNLIDSLKYMVCVIALAVLTGLCGIALGEDGGTKPILMLFLCATAILSITALFSELASTAAECVSKVSDFLTVASPILIGLLTALGCAGSVKILNPTLIFLADGITVLIQTIIIPMLLASGILTVINGLTDKIKLGRFVKLLQKSVKWLLGFATTIYIAVTTLGGMSAGAADGVSIRTARYAIDRLVPAVGGMVSGAVDTVMGSSLLLKNAAGTAAIVLIFGIIARPALQLVCGMLALRIASAICEPFSDERIPAMLDGTAETVSYLFAAVCAVASLFVINVIIIISIGGNLIG